MQWPKVSRMGALGGVIAALSVVILVQAGLMWSLRAKAQPVHARDQQAQQAGPATKPDQPGTVQDKQGKQGKQDQALDPFADLFSDPFFAGQSDPFEHMRKMEKRMDRLFARTMQHFGQWDKGLDKWGSPGLDRNESDLRLKEKADRYVLKTELPGVDESNLKVDVKDGQLTIRGKRKLRSESTKPKADESESEVSTERFEESVSLPDDVDTAHAKVDFHDGLLTVTLPKITH